MPEGDTIHVIANALRPRLEGQVLKGGRLRETPELELAGQRVREVRVHGKHLFFDLDSETDDDLELRTHLGMHGSWHRYPVGVEWQRPQRQASVVLLTEENVFVCFNAGEVECVRAASWQARDTRRRLGPDLMTEDPDPEALLQRARRHLESEALVVDLLLDQRVASGLGNVYKSEVLFLERVHPLTPFSNVDLELTARLFARGSELLRSNLSGGRRATRSVADGAGELWVYQRAGRPCLRCRTEIVSRRLGHGRRSTYWCPGCAPALS